MINVNRNRAEIKVEMLPHMVTVEVCGSGGWWVVATEVEIKVEMLRRRVTLEVCSARGWWVVATAEGGRWRRRAVGGGGSGGGGWWVAAAVAEGGAVSSLCPHCILPVSLLYPHSISPQRGV